MTTRIALFGCKSTTRYLFEALADRLAVSTIVTIAPELGAAHEVADYDDLRNLSDRVPVVQAHRYSLSHPADRSFFSERSFDLGFVIGWQRLIPPDILSTFRVGVFGMHGSAQNLPFGRGRSPLNWSIIENRGWFFTNLFRYMPGADDGPIAATNCFSIQPNDTGETLQFKNLLAMRKLVLEHHEALLAGGLELQGQPKAQATYYPKRDPADNLIDWDADVMAIERHVRAVAPPFGGAFSYRDAEEVRVLRAAIFYTDLESHPYKAMAPGTICVVFPNGKFCVRAVGGVIIVHSHATAHDVRLAEGDRLTSPPGALRAFARNKFGNFDLPDDPAR